MNIKSLFCKHDYKLKAKRKSMTYCTDYLYFSDVGMYDELLYVCNKCGKNKHKYVMNEEHPSYSKWKEGNK